jgi:hypothetical protein
MAWIEKPRGLRDGTVRWRVAAQQGWRLHSLQLVPVFGGLGKQTGVVLLAVYEFEC